MKLIIIYGPPGVGKLTVAKELSKITGFKLFHNHLSIELVQSLFPFGDPLFAKTVEKIRLDLLEAATKKKIRGVIFTLVYGKGVNVEGDDKFVRDIIGKVERNRGRVLFVRLFCNENELYKRIKHPSRKKFSKVKSKKVLKSIMDKYDIISAIPFRKSLEIDNTNLSPKKVAEKIKSHFRL